MKSPTQRDSLSITHYMIQPVHNTQYVTGPAKIDHVSAKKSPIFNVFTVS